MKTKCKAVKDVVEERKRQKEVEGFTLLHDLDCKPGALACAGMCYAGNAALTQEGKAQYTVPSHWPWDEAWWKPKSPRRDLVRAAALIIAEIERLDASKALASSMPLGS